MAIVGLGIDLVFIPDFAEQVDQPGTVFAETFTPGERRDAADKSSSAARHLAARWAAKEAVIKAWSGSRFAQRPVLPEGIHRDIEVVTDMWGRPKCGSPARSPSTWPKSSSTCRCPTRATPRPPSPCWRPPNMAWAEAMP